ncbi:MAG: bifunctional phosphoglucose/phosphomannose isomerase [Crocinitomicaceae bacterium]|jgi:glucose/mannose-6-phosphate isomerase|nr:bifunctional phosphoglucose/phosphomannose isomerase [Crocinitomicaceae bacterium]
MMRELIAAFPNNLKEGLQIAQKQSINPSDKEISNVVICGLGGSGIGGKIVSQWLEKDLYVPVLLCQDYDIPNFVGEKSLVIASSYSGNTEETLSSVEQAKDRGATIVAITSGGKLQEFCLEYGFNCTIVPGGNPPRTALAFSLVQLINIFESLGLVPKGNLSSIESARQLIEEQAMEIQTIAKGLASKIGKTTPAFYADARYEGVAVRAKQQFNENSKKLCWQHVIPEMNHNELVGWGGGSDQYSAIFLLSGDTNERNAKRFDISIDRTRSKTENTLLLEAKGKDIIERSLYLINVIDWASFFHAEMNGVDPIEIEIIDYLKSELGKM